MYYWIMRQKKYKLILMVAVAFVVIVLMDNIEIPIFGKINGSFGTVFSMGIFLFVITSWGIYRIKSVIHVQIKTLLVINVILMELIVVIERIQILMTGKDKGPLATSLAVSIICIAIWELLIELVIIPSNEFYSEIFESSSIPMEIVDENGKSYVKTKSAEPVNHETFKRLRKVKYIQPDIESVLKMIETKGGYLIWSEDVSELNHLNSELRGTYEETAQNVFALKSDIDVKSKMLHLEEQNKLYDMVSGKLRPQLEEIAGILEEIKETKDKDLSAKLWKRVSVIGTYVKRQSNLMLMAEGKESITIAELKRCLLESGANIQKQGIDCSMHIADANSVISSGAATICYELCELVLETALDEIKGVFVSTRVDENSFKMSIQINITSDILGPELDKYAQKYLLDDHIKFMHERQDESTYYLAISFFDRRKGGVRN